MNVPVRRWGRLRGWKRRSRMPAKELQPQPVQGDSHKDDDKDHHGGDDKDHDGGVGIDDHGVNGKDDQTWYSVCQRDLHLGDLGLRRGRGLPRGGRWVELQGGASKSDTGELSSANLTQVNMIIFCHTLLLWWSCHLWTAPYPRISSFARHNIKSNDCKGVLP